MPPGGVRRRGAERFASRRVEEAVTAAEAADDFAGHPSGIGALIVSRAADERKRLQVARRLLRT